MSTAYHTGLKSEPPSVAPQARVETKAGIAFVHDIFFGLPAEYEACDVFYTDLPWQAGFREFERRAGLSAERNYAAFLGAVCRLVLAADPRPLVLVTGKHAVKQLPTPGCSFPSKLNGADCVVLSYHTKFQLRHLTDTVAILHWLAARYQCVGDFCCGYGRAGRIFAEHGKRFVMSDYNPQCIGYIGETL